MNIWTARREEKRREAYMNELFQTGQNPMWRLKVERYELKLMQLTLLQDRWDSGPLLSSAAPFHYFCLG